MADEKKPEKKPSRSEKMYKDSPTVAKDDKGKATIKKGPSEKEKAAAKDNSGTEGMPEHDAHIKEMGDKHAMERLTLHQKHEKEHLEMIQKLSKELETPDAETGGEKIAKVETDKKE